jgi:hypothetical protein
LIVFSREKRAVYFVARVIENFDRHIASTNSLQRGASRRAIECDQPRDAIARGAKSISGREDRR